MALRIEDYAVIGNCETVALVGLNGSIDWLAMPRYDSPACFAGLLGNNANGHWLIAPLHFGSTATRRYRGDTLILETTFDTAGGTVRIVDFMSRRDGATDVVRIVEGLSGTVEMKTELVVRFDYGSIVPWVSRLSDDRLQMVAGPDRLVVSSPVRLQGEDLQSTARFEVREGQRLEFAITWSQSYRELRPALDVTSACREVETFWHDWVRGSNVPDRHREAVMRSLITLKALAHWETGGIVAAGTTSLPEHIGGPRNWDYRFCWLRDATFTLYALLGAGFLAEAAAWRRWLVRAVAGDPADLRILYGVGGERRLTETDISWLSGYGDSKPVRVGNAAANQFQLDVYGEVLDALYVARRAGLDAYDDAWALECALVGRLEAIWEQPDEGIWEPRSGRRHYVHSKVMAWVAFDRAIRSAEEFGLDGPLEHWKQVRAHIHATICARGFDSEIGSFVQSFGSKELDASLLLLAIVGFLPADDARIVGTVAAVERSLLRNGLVWRYDTHTTDDGLPPGEGAFLACSFWLADNYMLQNRHGEAEALFERLLDLRNDVGLLAEEYDPVARRQLGNFPQAFSHLALVNTARSIQSATGPAQQRAQHRTASCAEPRDHGSAASGPP